MKLASDEGNLSPLAACGGIMAMDSAAIEGLIRQGIPDAEVRIFDLGGDGEHYSAYIISESFRGKTRVQQHQMVYAALQGKMGAELHALAIQTAVPEKP